jgi:hypothetical protein
MFTGVLQQGLTELAVIDVPCAELPLSEKILIEMLKISDFPIGYFSIGRKKVEHKLAFPGNYHLRMSIEQRLKQGCARPWTANDKEQRYFSEWLHYNN